jgi:hypothetical protein
MKMSFRICTTVLGRIAARVQGRKALPRSISASRLSASVSLALAAAAAAWLSSSRWMMRLMVGDVLVQSAGSGSRWAGFSAARQAPRS